KWQPSGRSQVTWQGKGAKPRTVLAALYKGAVIRAPITPDRGVVKMRRAIVLHTNLPAADDPARCILVVGVTSDNREFDPAERHRYPPELFIPMPFAAGGTWESSFS